MKIQNLCYHWDPTYGNVDVTKDELSGTAQLFRPILDVEATLDMKMTTHEDLNYRTLFKRSFRYCKYISKPEREIVVHIFMNENYEIRPLAKYMPHSTG